MKTATTPIWTPEKIKTRLEEIKQAQYIAPPMPLTKIKGKTRHLARLEGVTVWAFFDQQPLAGSIPVGRENKKWSGTLLFLDPEGQLWTVPHIWYNDTWQARLESFRDSVQREQTRLEQARADLAILDKKPQLTKEEKQRQRELNGELARLPGQIKRLERKIIHIQKHADLNQCPCLQSLPPEPDDSV